MNFRTLLSAGLCLLLLFSGCAAENTADTKPIYTGNSAGGDSIHPEELVILIDADANDTIEQAAAYLGEALQVFLPASTRVQVLRSDSIQSDFPEAHLAFLSTSANPEFGRYFEALSDPFLFTGYEHFTLALNSRSVLDLLEDDLSLRRKAIPLGAYYTGSSFFLGSATMNGQEYFPTDEESSGDPPARTTPLITLAEDRGTAEALESPGANVQVLADAGDRMQALVSGQTQIAEFSCGDIPFAATEPVEMDLFYMQSFHSTDPLWLLVREAYFDSLGPEEKAWLTEAVAELYSEIDRVFLEKEETALRDLTEQYTLHVTDFSGTRNMIHRRSDEHADRIEEEQILIDRIRKIEYPQ